MSDDGFSNAIINNWLTPDKIGKFLIAAIVLAFTVGVTITQAEREHSQIRESQRQNTMHISTNASEVAALTLQLVELNTEVRRDQELSEERRQTAQDERARIQRMLEQLLARSPQ